MPQENQKETEKEFEISIVDELTDGKENEDEDSEDKEEEVEEKAGADDDEGDHADELDDDDEVKNYSKNVQKRIKQLTWQKNQERRKSEEAARLRDEAINFARNQQQQIEHMQRVLAQGERSMMDTASARYKAELESAKAQYRKAYEEGDTDKLIDAQEKMARISAQAQRWNEYRPRYRAQNQQQPQNQQPQNQQQQYRPPEPEPEAVEWAKKNPWFQKDRKMTSYAFGVHEELVSDKGLDPSSPEYYDELNKEMRKAFPDYFGKKKRTSSPQAPVVAPASRSQKTPRKVTLTRSQVELAKRLNITPEQYAAQLLKEMEEG